MSEKKWEKNLKIIFLNLLNHLLKEKIYILSTYIFNCGKIIHPTSVIINSHNDKTTNLNYRAILNTFLSTQIIPNGIACRLSILT